MFLTCFFTKNEKNMFVMCFICKLLFLTSMVYTKKTEKNRTKMPVQWRCRNAHTQHVANSYPPSVISHILVILRNYFPTTPETFPEILFTPKHLQKMF